jgi:hypothetical protein
LRQEALKLGISLGIADNGTSTDMEMMSAVINFPYQST